MFPFCADDVIIARSKHAYHTQLGKLKAFNILVFEEWRGVTHALIDTVEQCVFPVL